MHYWSLNQSSLLGPISISTKSTFHLSVHTDPLHKSCKPFLHFSYVQRGTRFFRYMPNSGITLWSGPSTDLMRAIKTNRPTTPDIIDHADGAMNQLRSWKYNTSQKNHGHNQDQTSKILQNCFQNWLGEWKYKRSHSTLHNPKSTSISQQRYALMNRLKSTVKKFHKR